MKYFVSMLLTAALFTHVVWAKPAAPEPEAQTIDGTTFYFTPWQAASAEAAFLDFLGKAKKHGDTVRMSIYGFTDVSDCDALVACAERGVDVQITMDSTEAAGPAQAPLVRRLKHAGVSVLIGKSPVGSQLLHIKATVVTTSKGKFTSWGSWNYSPSASKQENVLCFSSNPEVAELFLHYFQQIHDYLQDKQKE